MPSPVVIVVSAVVLRRPSGEVLTVRKHDTDRFMLRSGKPEPGETPAQTAVREGVRAGRGGARRVAAA